MEKQVAFKVIIKWFNLITLSPKLIILFFLSVQQWPTNKITKRICIYTIQLNTVKTPQVFNPCMASRKNEESNSSLKISILFDLSFNVLLILKKLLFLVLPLHLRILKPENYRKIGDRRVGGVKIREEWDEGRMLETNSKDEDGEDRARGPCCCQWLWRGGEK